MPDRRRARVRDIRERSGVHGTAWWRCNGALSRFMLDLLLSEARFLRPGGPVPPASAFEMTATLGEEGVGFDSLECTVMATALSEALFPHGGGLDGALPVTTRLGDWHAAALSALDRMAAAHVCFRSSGSTGQRKPFVHRLPDLAEEIDVFAAQFAGCRRIVVAVPSHHIYGFLFSLLLPARLDVPVVDMRDRFPGAVAAALQPGDLVVGHPGFWAALVQGAPTGWSPGVLGITSGAPCPDAVAEAVRSAGSTKLLQIYGSSETAGIGWRDHHAAPYQLLPFWRSTRDGLCLTRDNKTEVEIPDRLDWVDADTFHVRDRRDAAVQVGGINVYPARVRDVLRDHPDVADAVVRLMAPNEGTRLKAFIVSSSPNTACADLRRSLHAHVETRLGVAERPRSFVFGTSLPVTSAGKPADWPVSTDIG